MKYNKMLILFIFIIFSVTYGQTQLELNKKAKTDFENADNKLNKVYKEILLKYRNDTTFIKSMKEVQKIWIKFRDAQLKMKFPPYAAEKESILEMCKFNYLEELTMDRIRELVQWINGVEEGDVCSGSIKIKE
jgi:uncharacterized protein YecT (DUF1311 family)